MQQSFTGVELCNVTYRYGAHSVLRDVSAVFEPSRVYAIEGANGSGKSTLLRILSGELSPQRGSVTFHSGGERVNTGSRLDPRAARGRIGIVQHDAMLYPELTGRENLEFFASLYDLHSVASRLGALARALRLETYWNRTTRTYSRGQLQRVALARAFLHAPDLLLLDEPTTGLDEASCAIIEQMTMQACRDGAIVIVTSHDASVVERMGATRLRMREGRLAS